jgi:hypothetical protein
MMNDNFEARVAAHSEFSRARRQADLEQLSARLRGRDATLLPFETIRRNLRQQSPLYRGLHQIPLTQIVGSVGRYSEMTRQFLPLNDALRERWVKMAEMAQTAGWPPIELYKVGDAYFVRDGNHRVSAARQLKFRTIEAHVWEFPDEIHIGQKDNLDDILTRFRERDFLEKTGLASNRDDYDITFTTCGRYSEFQAQIEELQLKLQAIDDREISYQEAADAWYDLVYLPAVQVIRDSGLLEAFPGRTESDLFAWMSLHRERLEEQYGHYESLEQLADRLAKLYREKTGARLSRQFRRLLGSHELPPLAGLDMNEEEE